MLCKCHLNYIAGLGWMIEEYTSVCACSLEHRNLKKGDYFTCLNMSCLAEIAFLFWFGRNKMCIGVENKGLNAWIINKIKSHNGIPKLKRIKQGQEASKVYCHSIKLSIYHLPKTIKNRIFSLGQYLSFGFALIY